MSASFYDLLKYAATGIASPDMTYYDKLRASTLMGGVVKTLTGQPPLTFKADGSPLISWSMKGNGQQTGTPTPDAPIMPEFVGARTGNLFDYQTMAVSKSGYALLADGSESSNSQWSISDYIPINGSNFVLSKVGGNSFAICFYNANKQYVYGQAYATGGAGYKQSIICDVGTEVQYARFSYISDSTNQSYDNIANIMLNLGSTALPYEPFGYKIPISCGGETVPVYLGEVPTVRRVKKLVLNGTETLHYNASNNAGYIAINDGMQETISPYCDMLQGTTLPASDAPNNSVKQLKVNSLEGFVCGLLVKSSGFYNLTSFQQWLADNMPTFWYVLANEQTAISNEPLCKISTYADELNSTDAGVAVPTVKGNNTLTIDTPIQPSKMTITYKG